MSMSSKDSIMPASAFRTAQIHDIEFGLEQIMTIEEHVQNESSCSEFLNLTPDNVRTFGLALIQEVNEFINELPRWKPWKKEKEVDRERLTDEFADILAFLGIMMSWMDQLDIFTQDLAEAFVKKSQVNIQRLTGKVEGYGLDHSVELKEVE